MEEPACFVLHKPAPKDTGGGAGGGGGGGGGSSGREKSETSSRAQRYAAKNRGRMAGTGVHGLSGSDDDVSGGEGLPPCFAGEPASCRRLRLQAYKELWCSVEGRIKDIITRSNEDSFKLMYRWIKDTHGEDVHASGFVDDINVSGSDGDVDGEESARSPDYYSMSLAHQLPTALLFMGGIDSCDHSTTFAALSRYLDGKCHVACLKPSNFNSANSITPAVESMLKQFTGITPETTDIEILASWYFERSIVNQHPLVIIIEDAERCDSAILQHLVMILSDWRADLPIFLVLGMSTSAAALRRILPAAAIARLRPQRFAVKLSQHHLASVFREVLLDAKTSCGIVLADKVVDFLYGVFLRQELTVTSVLRGLQMAYLEHFSSQPLSFLCRELMKATSEVRMVQECGMLPRQLLEIAAKLPSAVREMKDAAVGRNNNQEAVSDRLGKALWASREAWRKWAVGVTCLHVAASMAGVLSGGSICELYRDALGSQFMSVGLPGQLPAAAAPSSSNPLAALRSDRLVSGFDDTSSSPWYCGNDADAVKCGPGVTLIRAISNRLREASSSTMEDLLATLEDLMHGFPEFQHDLQVLRRLMKDSSQQQQQQQQQPQQPQQPQQQQQQQRVEERSPPQLRAEAAAAAHLSGSGGSGDGSIEQKASGGATQAVAAAVGLRSSTAGGLTEGKLAGGVSGNPAAAAAAAGGGGGGNQQQEESDNAAAATEREDAGKPGLAGGGISESAAMAQRGMSAAMRRRMALQAPRQVRTQVTITAEKVSTVLRRIANELITSFELLPFHEVFCFSDVSVLEEAISATPRASIQHDLVAASARLKCECCTNDGSISSTMHDTSIAFCLYRHSDEYINIHDWYKSFEGIYAAPPSTPPRAREAAQSATKRGAGRPRKRSREEEEAGRQTVDREKGKERDADGCSEDERKKKSISSSQDAAALQARFVRATSELQVLGLVRVPGKRRPDHVQRVAYGG
ncbi:hypothetical protein CBR_g52284 [Chara braunii]|uniref:Uncharacterized protein n=1 Tax=Chara braunii TaxID=69332 RepID=A0A388M9Z5_CHABU|nr:hypothetical protein CBR_g52284 [Chara braunii]|eukprot:GBG91397.1 hypothetical protein CBR_g52284 [Chara braunii]